MAVRTPNQAGFESSFAFGAAAASLETAGIAAS
jgi:hypothetical protein